MWRRTRSKERQFAAELARFQRQSGWLDPRSEKGRAHLRAVQERRGEVRPDEFVALDTIGAGNFGVVKRGVLLVKGDGGNDMATLCAAKMLVDSSPEQEERFFSESERLKILRHDNIVGMLGMCHKDGCSFLLMEYCELGDLASHLQNSAKAKSAVSTLERIWYAAQAAAGMAYLHRMRLVHRDIAARNILLDHAPNDVHVPVTADGRRLPIAKVSDFGLSRMMNDSVYVAATAQQLPVRWMAPEAIRDSLYTEATDVWSFAVLVWEIFENAEMPLARQFPNGRDLLLAMVQGRNIEHEQPYNCPQRIWDLAARCFSRDPAARPSMEQLQLDFFYAVSEAEGSAGEKAYKSDCGSQYGSLYHTLSLDCTGGYTAPGPGLWVTDSVEVYSEGASAFAGANKAASTPLSSFSGTEKSFIIAKGKIVTSDGYTTLGNTGVRAKDECLRPGPEPLVTDFGRQEYARLGDTRAEYFKLDPREEGPRVVAHEYTNVDWGNTEDVSGEIVHNGNPELAPSTPESLLGKRERRLSPVKVDDVEAQL